MVEQGSPGAASPAWAGSVPPPTPPEHPQATTVLVLGILGVVGLAFVAPFAWYLGRQALTEIDANPGAWSRREHVYIGYILGIVGTVILAFVLVVFGIMFIVWAGMLISFAGSM